MEEWKDAKRNDGTLEQWNNRLKTREKRIRLYPIFQPSSILIFHHSGLFYLDPQLEQFDEEQEPQEEAAVLLNFPPTEKAKADITRVTLALWHLGQEIFSEEFKTSFSNSFSQFLHWYS